MTIEEFVDALALEESALCENFYKEKIQRNNLIIYLEEMMKIGTDILFVGEAPGYLGCAITGIPFTDERIIKQYSFLPGKYVTKGCQKESAKAMWDVLQDSKRIPLLWNAFPLHPYEAGNIKSNRTPTQAEKKAIGEKYIKFIMDMFEIKRVYAVGVQAYDTLKRMDIAIFDKDKEKSYIRHPSYGGKRQCQEKIREIFENESNAQKALKG